jgi:hypothetical protein
LSIAEKGGVGWRVKMSLVAFESDHLEACGSINAAILYNKLIYLHNEKFNKLEFYQTDKRLQQSTFLKRRQFENAKKQLRDRGLISYKSTGVQDFTTNYTILKDLSEACTKRAATNAPNVHTTNARNVHTKNNNIIQNNITTTTRVAVVSDINEKKSIMDSEKLRVVEKHMQEFKIAKEDLDKFLMTYSIEEIKAAIDYVLSKPNGRSKAGYFVDTLTKGWAKNQPHVKEREAFNRHSEEVLAKANKLIEDTAKRDDSKVGPGRAAFLASNFPRKRSMLLPSRLAKQFQVS